MDMRSSSETPALERTAAENGSGDPRWSKSSLIYPMLCQPRAPMSKEEIPSMAGQYRYSVDRMRGKAD